MCENFISSKSTQVMKLKSLENNSFVQENLNISYVQSSDGQIVPIPEGYVVSEFEEETYVKNGFVIYERNISSENNSDDNKLKFQSKYNQYVWVPVNREELLTIYGVDKNGKMCGKLYSYDKKNGRMNKDWSIVNGKFYAKKGSLEPGLGTGANADIIGELVIASELGMTREEFQEELEISFYKTIKSIKKYGGFYIGRYETGMEEDTAVIKRMNNNLNNQTWTQMYKNSKKINGEKDNVWSTMIWGSLWDYTIYWFINTGAKTYEDIYLSTDWGNYNTSIFEYYKDTNGNKTSKEKTSGELKLIPSGSSDYTKVNNIYDMAGNVGEYALEMYNQYVSYRGGRYDVADEIKSCGYRGKHKIDEKDETIGSRAILLIK